MALKNSDRAAFWQQHLDKFRASAWFFSPTAPGSLPGSDHMMLTGAACLD